MSGMTQGSGPIRLVISDVDGTLVDKAKQLTSVTVDAVRRLREAGVPFTLISARPVSGVMPMVARLGIGGPVAAFNGGTLFRADGTTIERHRIDPEVVRGMAELAAGFPVSTWIFAEDQWHADTLDNPHVPHERISANQEPVVCPDMSALYARADKVTYVHDDPELLGRLTAEGQRRFGDRATVGQSQTYYLDITDLAANKGAGITALAAAHGVALEQVAVIGDMHNDVPMFDLAGLAIAMGQAPDDVKSRADAVSSSNDADGVAHAIDELILPRLGVPDRLWATGGASMKKLVAFDMDGTLALSKQRLDADMAQRLARLLTVAKVAVISGGDWPQFEKQVVSQMPADARIDGLFIMPTTGTKMYRHDGEGWRAIYAELFDDDEKHRIVTAFNASLEATGFRPEQTWGELIEDRGSQITFSALGQQAPLEAKEKWDPDFAKRRVIQADLKDRLPGFAINAGGATSIDITREGVNKATGLRKLADQAGIPTQDMIFIGDAIFPGGNDYPPFEAGIDCVRVKTIDDTRSAIDAIVCCLKV